MSSFLVFLWCLVKKTPNHLRILLFLNSLVCLSYFRHWNRMDIPPIVVNSAISFSSHNWEIKPLHRKVCGLDSHLKEALSCCSSQMKTKKRSYDIVLNWLVDILPLRTLLKRLCMSWPVNGGFKAAISYRTQPTDHTSDFES